MFSPGFLISYSSYDNHYWPVPKWSKIYGLEEWLASSSVVRGVRYPQNPGYTRVNEGQDITVDQSP